MKKTTCIFIISLLFFSCEKNNYKENYLEQKIPMVYNNLNKDEIESFKNSMYIEEGKLLSWDMNLLKKGTKNEFDSIITNITRELGGPIENIVITDENGDEIKVDSDKFLHKSLDGKEYILNDFNNQETFILVTSLNCGVCYTSFEKLNEIVMNNSDKNKKYVAVFKNSAEHIEKYKDGYKIKRFGFLNEKWIIFSKETDIIQKLNIPYSESTEGYPVLIYKKGNSFIKEYDLKEIEKIL